ncbi:unnamed protein product [Durusdinium trenchii]|uniref:Kelch-like protein 12 (CUL3-interacting protein 1) n=2 Tax=Durusdinium trenchii TaxID=1381693 RepID=A0ABP0ILS7_9DINO
MEFAGRDWQLQIENLKDEVRALKESVITKGFLSEDFFLSYLHRIRFQRVCQQHPWKHCPDEKEVGLWSVLQAGLSKAVLGFAGVAAVGALCRASRELGAEASKAKKAVDCLAAGGRGQVFICGGYDGSRLLSEVHRFDPKANSWGSVPALPVPREASVAAVLGGQIVVCGGFDGQRQLDQAVRFDPMAGTWQELPPMHCRRSGATAAVVQGHGLVVCGGFDGEEYLSSVERLTDHWEMLPSMTFSREGASCAELWGKVYVCGGNDGANTLKEVERFNFEVGQWEALPPMLVRRDGPAAAALSGRIWVCGGFDGQQSLSLSSIECFDPHRGFWRKLRSMLSRRAGAACAVVSGQLYICGGYDGAQNLQECERLDPAQGMWELLPSMPRRCGYCAGASS